MNDEIKSLKKLVYELETKINNLESKVYFLENTNKIQNINREDSITIDDFLNSLNINEEDIQLVVNNNFVIYIKYFINKNRNIIPIKRYNRKVNININNKWCELKKEHSDKILKFIHKKMIKIFNDNFKNNIIIVDEQHYINKVLLLNDNINEKIYIEFNKIQ